MTDYVVKRKPRLKIAFIFKKHSANCSRIWEVEVTARYFHRTLFCFPKQFLKKLKELARIHY